MKNKTTELVSTLETKIKTLKALNASGVSAKLDDINRFLDVIITKIVKCEDNKAKQEVKGKAQEIYKARRKAGKNRRSSNINRQ